MSPHSMKENFPIGHRLDIDSSPTVLIVGTLKFTTADEISVSDFNKSILFRIIFEVILRKRYVRSSQCCMKSRSIGLANGRVQCCSQVEPRTRFNPYVHSSLSEEEFRDRYMQYDFRFTSLLPYIFLSTIGILLLTTSYYFCVHFPLFSN